MSKEKAKRKDNPRRLLKRQLIVIILLFMTIGNLYQRWTQKDDIPQIAFIAPYDNSNSIWLVSATENATPRLAVQLEHKNHLRLFPMPNHDSVIYQYKEDDGLLYNFVLDTKTGFSQPLSGLETCYHNITGNGCYLRVHENWILYDEVRPNLSTDDDEVTVNLLNMETEETREIFHTMDVATLPYYTSPNPSWVPNHDLVVYRDNISSDAERYVFFSVNQNQVVDEVSVEPRNTIHFSPDGTQYTQFNPVAKVTTIYRTENTIPFLTIASDDHHIDRISAQGWHPTDSIILLRFEVQELGWSHHEYHLYEYNMDIGSTQQLTDYTSQSYAYNADGSLILTSRWIESGAHNQLIVIETFLATEMPLSAFGTNPVWVHGGQ